MRKGSIQGNQEGEVYTFMSIRYILVKPRFGFMLAFGNYQDPVKICPVFYG